MRSKAQATKEKGGTLYFIKIKLPQKIKQLPADPAIPLPGIYTREMKRCSHKLVNEYL